MRGSIRPMGEKGEEEASARDDDCFLPRRPPSARMSPHQVIPRRVASLQSPLPFHLVSSFRYKRSASLRRAYKGKRYWPLSCKMSPC